MDIESLLKIASKLAMMKQVSGKVLASIPAINKNINQVKNVATNQSRKNVANLSSKLPEIKPFSAGDIKPLGPSSLKPGMKNMQGRTLR